MKRKLHHILLLSAFAIIGSANAGFTQDSGLMDVEFSDSEKEKIDRDKIINSPGEADSRYSTKYTVTPKDSLTGASVTSTSKAVTPANSLQIRKTEKIQAAPKPAEKQNKAQDDSILSFNFLYYIIEKYKLQDIVD
jgi:hypothetical protein